MLGGKSEFFCLEYWAPTGDEVMLKCNKGMHIHDSSYVFTETKIIVFHDLWPSVLECHGPAASFN